MCNSWKFRALVGATLCVFVVSIRAQTSVTTDPVGFTTTSCASGYDTYVSIPFTRPPEFTGTVQSVSTVDSTHSALAVNGSSGWNNNQFVYVQSVQPKTYYVLIGSGGATNPKQGHVYSVTANSSNTLTVAITSYDDLTGVVAGTQVNVIPYWTPASLFPASDAGVSFTPTTSSSAYKTQLRIPAVATAGTYSYPTTYFYSNNIDGSTSGWRVIGDNTTDRGDYPLLSDSYLVVRNDNGAPTLPLTELGSVVMKRVTAPIFTSSSQSLDNPVAMIRPVDVSLNQSGFGPADRSFVQGDQLLLFTNNQISASQTPSATYTYDTAWRIAGDTASDHGSDLIPAGSAIVVSKAISTSGTGFWVNSPSYVSGLTPRPVQVTSRQTHIGKGSFDADLYTVGSPGVECRLGDTTGNGKDFHIVATFPLPLTSSPGVNPPTSKDGLATADAPTFANVNGRGVVTINLHNVTNAQLLTVTLTGVSTATDTGDVSLPMGVLFCDVNANRSVEGNDVSSIQGHIRQSLGISNFRYDVNLNGSIEGNDVSSAQGKIRTSF